MTLLKRHIVLPFRGSLVDIKGKHTHYSKTQSSSNNKTSQQNLIISKEKSGTG